MRAKSSKQRCPALCNFESINLQAILCVPMTFSFGIEKLALAPFPLCTIELIEI